MAVPIDLLPRKIYLEDFNGNYKNFISAVFEVFERDFNKNKPSFGGVRFGLKFHPSINGKAYTFYHMTHKGKIENERTPDLRRCECMPWARVTIDKTIEYSLRFWEQDRNNKKRICIWLDPDNKGDEDYINYFVILDVRKNYILPWTAFVAEYKHELKKKKKEYEEWMRSQNQKTYTPKELVEKIIKSIT